MPRLQRRTREGGGLPPPLSLQGLAWGDVEPARRGLWGAGAPLSPASLTRLKAHWPLEDAGWQQRRLEDLAVVDVWAAGL